MALTEHRPVLLKEVVDLLQVKPDGVYVDGTLGGGGHAEAVLKKMGGGGLYVGIDRDPSALQRARERLTAFGQVRIVHGVYSEIPRILDDLKIRGVDGVIVDLGVSSFQLESAERGFSFSKEGPLDMRMDPTEESPTAADLVNDLPEEELTEIFQKFGEERFARRIARAIATIRRAHPFTTTASLAHVIRRAVPPKFKGTRGGIHPATRVFQALRIAVNGELDHLRQFLELDFEFLKEGGRIVVISFHSLEDRLVKGAFRSHGKLKALTKKPITADEEELSTNPRARSAKLRAAEKKGNGLR